MGAPLVSVIVLNFNGEQIIARCLDHLLAQTYPNLQILVVDNDSHDGSDAILRAYEADGRVTVLRSPTNLGCAGGRNLALPEAQGEIVAFMDNDGYAAPDWLAAAVRVLDGDARVAAVAPLVFFNRHKLILNGAGGTLNQRGYGGDFCYREPYEFARLPHYVLYPMGCGMVMRRAVLDEMRRFDAALFNYYDDVEVGLWAWRLGRQVVCAPEAWVDHDFSASDVINQNKALLCERNRVRTVLKYFPAAHLPGWLVRELLSFVPRGPRWRWALPYKVWSWNLWHLVSALRVRRRFGAARGGFRNLLDPGWGDFPPPCPNNQLNQPDPTQAGATVDFCDDDTPAQLNFGWYSPERDRQRTMRWTSGAASAFVHLPAGVAEAAIEWRGGRADQQTTLRLRPVGELGVVWEAVDALPTEWTTQQFPCDAPAGLYELQVLTSPVFGDRGNRALGVAVTRIAFA
ncbi:MAG: glycosyltransferase family 2 protein [Candidatus Binatia bacterium]